LSKKIIKDEFVPSEKLKKFGYAVYETVERGEKPKKLEKVGEMEYTPGEVDLQIFSFDNDIEIGKAIVVQDRDYKCEKYQPKAFSEEEAAAMNAKSEEPEEVIEEEPPPPPAISEEELEAARKEAYAQGMAEGLKQGEDKGYKNGKAEAEKKYEAEKSDYIKSLNDTYKEVIAQQDVFKNAVNELDEALPNIIIGMVTDIVGEERKINDDIVASIAKKSLAHLRELEKVIFLVNPDDVESMKAEFPDYETQADKNVV